MSKTELEKFKTRWRRWLGNKTRFDGSAWTTLLSSNWLGWADRVLGDDYPGVQPWTPREVLKAVYARAIDVATMEDLYRLDGLYATERIEKLLRRQ